MKILVLTKYDQKGASSRLRSIQYFNGIRAAGIDIDHSPLFDSHYLTQLYSGSNPNARYVLYRYLRRFIKLLSAKKYDLLWIEKELFPWIPFNIEGLLSKFGIKYIVDYDDAIFHNYDLHSKKIVRLLLTNKIPNVMKSAMLVTVCNQYLKKKAIVSGAKHIEIIPTVVDLNKYTMTSKNDNQQELTIGWIGSPSTEKYLIELTGVFEKLTSLVDFKLIIIGGKKFFTNKFKYELIDWSEAKEVELIQKFDIGIMPLSDSLWEKGKCGYKLIQYMACGKPVIASAVGMNCEIIQNDENGYLCNNDEEWIEAFLNLSDRAKRDKFGTTARKLIEKKYSLSVTMQQRINTIKKSI